MQARAKHWRTAGSFRWRMRASRPTKSQPRLRAEAGCGGLLGPVACIILCIIRCQPPLRRHSVPSLKRPLEHEQYGKQLRAENYQQSLREDVFPVETELHQPTWVLQTYSAPGGNVSFTLKNVYHCFPYRSSLDPESNESFYRKVYLK